jgi:hypothetical protein
VLAAAGAAEPLDRVEIVVRGIAGDAGHEAHPSLASEAARPASGGRVALQ